MMPKIDKTNWFEHVKDPNDYAEYMTMFEKYDPEGYARYEHEEHLASMAQAEQERQAFRNYYETNEEQWDEMERERMMFPFDPQA
jgi:hypothetical protein